jgi:hypothetical protein
LAAATRERNVAKAVDTAGRTKNDVTDETGALYQNREWPADAGLASAMEESQRSRKFFTSESLFLNDAASAEAAFAFDVYVVVGDDEVTSGRRTASFTHLPSQSVVDDDAERGTWPLQLLPPSAEKRSKEDIGWRQRRKKTIRPYSSSSSSFETSSAGSRPPRPPRAAAANAGNFPVL